MDLEEKIELKRVPESTLCIPLKGGLEERKEAEETYAEDFGPEILHLLESRELVLLPKVLKEWDQVFWLCWGMKLLGVKSMLHACKRVAGESLKKSPQGM